MAAFDADDLDRDDIFKQLITSSQKGQFFPSGRNNPAMRVGGEAGTPPVGIDDNTLTRKLDIVNSTLTFEGRTRSFGTAGVEPDTAAAIWQIKKIAPSGGDDTTLFANDGKYDQVWDDRATLFPPAVFFNALSTVFDGVNDFIDFGDNHNFENSVQFSLSLWMRANNFSAQRCLWSKSSNDANVFGWSFYHDASGKLFLQMRASGQLRAFTFNSILSALTWHHIVLTYDGSQNISGVRAYVDAVVENTPPSGAVTASLLTAEPSKIARRSASFHFVGHIDEVSFWDKRLSSSEVNAVYNSGSPDDVTMLPFAGNLAHYYRMGDNDTFPTISDNENAVNGTMTNMAADDFVSEVP